MNRWTILSLLNHTVACILLVRASSFWLNLPVWRANKALGLVVAIVAGAYLASAFALTWIRPAGGRERILRVLGVGLGMLALAFIGLEWVQWRWPGAYQDLATGPLAFYFLVAGLATLALVTFAGELLPPRLGFVVTVVLAGGLALVFARRRHRGVRRQQPDRCGQRHAL